MSVCKDYTAEQERVELLELARRACAMFGCDDSPENLEWALEGWCLFASCHDVSVLEAGKKALTEFEIADKINAEATTCRERRTFPDGPDAPIPYCSGDHLLNWNSSLRMGSFFNFQ